MSIIEKSKNILSLLKGYFHTLYAGLERIPTEPKDSTESLYRFFKSYDTKCVITTPVYMTEKENVETLILLDYLKSGERGGAYVQ